MMKSLQFAVGGIVFLSALGSGGAALATSAPRYSGAVTGVFDTALLTGAFLEVDSRLPVPCDNTSKAAGFGLGTSSLTWGDSPGGVLAPSAVEFVGKSFDDVAAGEIFPLGTLSYFNGENSPASLIFGLGLELSAGDGIEPFAGPVDIVSTRNGRRDQMADADVLVFDTFEVPSTLAAFESTGVTATVYGKIGSDAKLEVTSMSLEAGEAEHGCVSEGPLVDARPCASACGGVCAAAALAVAGPLCGGEQLPTSVRTRLDRALHLLDRGASKDSERKAKKGVRLAMKQLRRSAAIAEGASKKGRISAECAEAVDVAIRNARSQAEAWLGTE